MTTPSCPHSDVRCGLSSSARCAPLLGSDMVKDDQRVGWNGGVGKFVGKWLRDQKILTLAQMNPKAAREFPRRI